MTPLSFSLLEFLRANSGASFTQRELSVKFSVQIREIQYAIQELRADFGAPICSGDAGIWLARDRKEAEAMIEKLKNRAIHQLETQQKMREKLYSWFPEVPPEPVQTTMFEVKA